MRVLFLTCASKTHLYGMVPLAWALRTAGHEVRVASQPNPLHMTADDVANTGLTAVSVGEPIDVSKMVNDVAEEIEQPAEQAVPETRPALSDTRSVQSEYAQDDPHAELDMLTRHVFPMFNADTMIDDLVSFARSWKPDLVVWDGMVMTYAGPVVARAAGAAHARFLFGADAVVQLRDAARRQRPDSDPMRDAMAPILERYGCAFGDDLVTGNWTINTMPPWTWRPPGIQYLGMRPVAYNGPSTVPSWVFEEEPERRRVCICLGMTAQETQSGASADALLNAVGDLDIEVIATLTPEQLAAMPNVPDNVRAVDFVPLTALLPTCAAIVNHGGPGTVASALEHGVPQLIVPSTLGSQKWWAPVAQANGLAEQGAGRYVCDDYQLTPELLREHLVRVLDDPSYTENAARLRMELLKVPAPNDVIPAVEKLTAEFHVK